MCDAPTLLRGQLDPDFVIAVQAICNRVEQHRLTDRRDLARRIVEELLGSLG